MDDIRQLLDDRRAHIERNASTGVNLAHTQWEVLSKMLIEQIKEAALQLRAFAPQHTNQAHYDYGCYEWLFLVTKQFGSKKQPVALYISLEGEEVGVYTKKTGSAIRKWSLDNGGYVDGFFDVLRALQYRLMEG